MTFSTALRKTAQNKKKVSCKLIQIKKWSSNLIKKMKNRCFSSISRGVSFLKTRKAWRISKCKRMKDGLLSYGRRIKISPDPKKVKFTQKTIDRKRKNKLKDFKKRIIF